ncbi:PqqD family protein [Nonomuraea sp. NPDC050404]|uniref:PqqD family protein n=1 Tax=Nonomuraea sp. NPDC050404 TaxID=3155783 RepID=UPI0033CEFCF5
MSWHLGPNVRRHGHLLFDVEAGGYFALNPTAALVVDALIEGRSLAEAADKLSNAYVVTSTQAHADVKALVSQLSRADLLMERIT